MNAYDYLDQLEFFGMKLGLERMQQLMKLLGNPEQKYKVIHVAGTNGKGSVASMVASMLRSAGHKVGLYTSPHLVRFNERIVVDGIEISDDELEKYVEKLKTLNEREDVRATYFEFTTALAFLSFADKNVEIAVVETGIGGRLDATNVVKADFAVITSIGLEHTEHLGSTLVEVASEKCGIIKDGSVVIVGEVYGGVFEVIRRACSVKHAKLVRVHEMYHGEIGLRGEFQRKNAAVAVAVVKRLGLGNDAIEKGLRETKWSGRLDYVRDNILVDCAHNPSGMKKLCEFISGIGKKKVLLLGIAEDKDAEAMVQQIVPLVDAVIVTEGLYKPMDGEKLGGVVRRYTDKISIIKNSELALVAALEKVDDGLILVTGSIYLVGDLMKHLNSQTI
jgi:dihydrofolate synthase / folylpolyglutamate synthase